VCGGPAAGYGAGTVTVLASRVTAVCASILPLNVAPVCIEIDVWPKKVALEVRERIEAKEALARVRQLRAENPTTPWSAK
jgi:hypothetical protein